MGIVLLLLMFVVAVAADDAAVVGCGVGVVVGVFGVAVVDVAMLVVLLRLLIVCCSC